MNFLDGGARAATAASWSRRGKDFSARVDEERFEALEAGREGHARRAPARRRACVDGDAGAGGALEVEIVEALGSEAFAHGGSAARRSSRGSTATRGGEEGRRRSRVAVARRAPLRPGERSARSRRRSHEAAPPSLSGRALLVGALALAFLLSRLRLRATRRNVLRLWHAYRGDEEKALEAILASYHGRARSRCSRSRTTPSPRSSRPRSRSARGPTSSSTRTSASATTALASSSRPSATRSRSDAAFVAARARRGAGDGQACGACRSRRSAWRSTSTTDLVHEVPAELEGIAELAGQAPRGRVPARLRGAERLRHARALLAPSAGASSTTDDGYRLRRARRPSSSIELARGSRRAARGPGGADGALVTKLFRAGKAAFAISGPWLAADLGEQGHCRYRVAELPRVRATGAADAPAAHGRVGDDLARRAPRAPRRGASRGTSRAPTPRAIRAPRRPGRPRARTDVALGAGRRRRARARSPSRRRLAIPMPVVARDARRVGPGATAPSARCSAATRQPADALDEAKRRFDRRAHAPAARRVADPRAARAGRAAALRRVRAGSARAREERSGASQALAARVPLRRPRGARGRRARDRCRSSMGAATSLFAGNDERRAALRRASPTTSTSSPRAAARCSRAARSTWCCS